jgi:predicted DNA-binding transcriptional regulator AlpA
MKTDMAEPQTPDQQAPAEEKLFTLSEISQRTGISMPTLQRYKKTYQDRLPSVGAGRKQRYPEHALPVFAELRSENAGRRGRPRKNAAAATGSGRSSATPKRRPGRPAGARAAGRVGRVGRVGRRGRPARAAVARAAKPARGAAKTGRRPGRPRKVQPATPARRGRPPGRPRKAAAGRRALPVRRGRVGRPPGSGRRAAGAGRRPGRVGRAAAAARRAAGRSKTEGLLTLTQISKTTGISYPTLVRYVRLYSNRLPHAGKGRARRFYPEAVEVFRSLRQESGRGGRRAGGGRRAAPGTARRGRPPKAAASGVAGRLEAMLVQRVRDLERFRQDVEKRFGDLVRGLQKLR